MSERSWSLGRAALLVAATTLVSPISPVLLVFVPVALLLLAFRRGARMGIGIALLILLLAFGDAGSGAGEMGWLVQRGWTLLLGGAFVLVVAAEGERSTVGRSLAAVGICAAAVTVLEVLRPQLWAELEWWMSGEIRHAAFVAQHMLESFPAAADPGIHGRLAEAVDRWLDFQEQVYPALLALGSLAALGVAWFVFARLSGRERGLGPVREFRFNDHLVWVLVGGLALVVLPMGAAVSRVGENAALFMAALYFVRGLAVMMWVAAAVLTSTWTAWLLALAAVFLYPLVVGTALVLGLSDTWLDLRARLRTGEPEA